MVFQHKINIPFAENGDKSNIPEEDENNNVSLSQGFTSKYAMPYYDGGKYVYREEMNGILNKAYVAIKELQELSQTLEAELVSKINETASELSSQIANAEERLGEAIDQLSLSTDSQIQDTYNRLHKEIADLETALKSEDDTHKQELINKINEATASLNNEITNIKTALDGKIDIEKVETVLSGEEGKLPDSKAIKEFVLANAGSGNSENTGGSEGGYGAFNYNNALNKLDFPQADYDNLSQKEKTNGKMYLVHGGENYKIYYNDTLVIQGTEKPKLPAYPAAVAIAKWTLKIDTTVPASGYYHAFGRTIPLIDGVPYTLHKVQKLVAADLTGTRYLVVKKADGIDSETDIPFPPQGESVDATMDENYKLKDDEILLKVSWNKKFNNASYYMPEYLTQKIDTTTKWVYNIQQNSADNFVTFEVVKVANNLQASNKHINGLWVVIRENWTYHAKAGVVEVTDSNGMTYNCEFNEDITPAEYYEEYQKGKGGKIEMAEIGKYIQWV